MIKPTKQIFLPCCGVFAMFLASRVEEFDEAFEVAKKGLKRTDRWKGRMYWREEQRQRAREIGEGAFFEPLPETIEVIDMLGRFVFLADGSRVFDTRHPKHILPFSDFKNMTAASVTFVETGEFDRNGKPKTKPVSNAALWLRDTQRKTAITASFKAGAGLFIHDTEGKHCVNTWKGFADLGKPIDPAILLDHIRWLYSDRADDYLDWLAHARQFPGILPHTSWLHISSHTGTGRNAVGLALAKLFSGYAAMGVDLNNMLDSGFNGELSCKVIAVIDEIRVGGGNQWKHSEALKHMITAQIRHINPKYGRPRQEYNSCRFNIYSNHRSAVPLDDTDRRVEVVICDYRPKDPAYYQRLYTAIENNPGVIAGFAKFLDERDLSGFNPGRHAKRTADKLQVISMNRTEEASALSEFSKKYPCDLVTATRLNEAAGVEGFGNSTALRHIAEEAGWIKLECRYRLGGQQHRVYVKKERFAYWSENPTNVRDQIPQIDGGAFDWLPEGRHGA